MDELSGYIGGPNNTDIKASCEEFSRQTKLDKGSYLYLSENKESIKTCAKEHYDYVITFRDHFLTYIHKLYIEYLKKARLFTDNSGKYNENSYVYWIERDYDETEENKYIWLKMDRGYRLKRIDDNFVGLKDGFIDVNKPVKEKLSFTNRYYKPGNDKEVSFFCVIKK